MAFKDCILDHVKAGRLTAGQSERLLRKYDALKEKYLKEGLDLGAADKAANDVINQEAEVLVQKKRNEIQHALKQKDINEKLDAQEGKINKKVENLYAQTFRRGETVQKTLYSMMNDFADKFSKGFFELKRDHKSIEAAVRSVLGEAVEDADAKALGNMMKQLFDYSHSRYKTAGGVIGKLDNYFPQVHRAEAIRKVDKDEWIDFVLEKVDLEKMTNIETGRPFTPDELRAVLSDTYDEIVTGGAAGLAKRVEAGKTTPGGRAGDVSLKRQASRFIFFKDADSFIDYNARFGTGERGLAQAFLSHLDSISKDIGMLEVLGPKPDSMSRFLDLKMRAEGASSVKRDWVNAQYRVMRGLGYTDSIDAMWYKVITIPQNIIRSAVMGAASLSAISDSAFLAATAKINGMNATRALGTYLKLMSPFKNEAKEIAKRAGLVVDAMNGAVLNDSRFAGEMLDGKVTRYLAGIVNKFSGLDLMTRATKDAITLEGLQQFGRTIADQVPYSKLDEDFRAMLSQAGITEADWNNLLKAKVHSPRRGLRVLITNELRVDPNLDVKVAADLANKVDDLMNSLRQMASNESNLITRAITTGEIVAPGVGRQGGIGRAFASSAFMLKTFPITVLNTHLLPAIRRARVQKKYDHLAMVTIGTTLIGAMAMQLKDLSKGKEPKDMDDHKFWIAALLQGGGLGLFGDFFLQDRSRFGRSLTVELGGPLPGLVDDIFRATKGNFDRFADGKEQNFLRDVLRLVKRNTPLSSLWYARLVLERMLFDNLERMADPKFDQRIRRQERKMKKESGQEFWWRPGG